MHGNGCAPAARPPAVLGTDLAGGSVVTVVTDLAGGVLARAGAPVLLSRPRGGWVEADPRDWLAGAIVTIRRAVHEAGTRPLAVGLAGPAHGLVLVDAAGVPVRPAILGPDARAAARLAGYRDLPDPLRRGLVNPLSPARFGPMLSWIATHEPAAYARARWALQPKDWLRAQLTGDRCTEPSDASATLLYDLHTGTWSGAAARLLGLDPGRLPAVLPGAGHRAGGLTRSGADLLGLPAGLPVAAGAARTAAGALGAGLTAGGAARVALGPDPHVVAALGDLPAGLPLTGEAHVQHAATDRGWCVSAAVAEPGRHRPREPGRDTVAGPVRARLLARDVAAAVRSVTALAPVTGLRVHGARTVPPGLLDLLAELVELPVCGADAPDPVARAAALLGARAAGLLDEESVRARLSPAPHRCAVPSPDPLVDPTGLPAGPPAEPPAGSPAPVLNSRDQRGTRTRPQHIRVESKDTTP